MHTRYRDLASILTEFRQIKEFSLRQIENIIGISYSYYSKIERREVTPPKETVITIADKLGISRYQLINGAGYIVDLGIDVETRDLDWDLNKLNAHLNAKYRIISIPNFKVILNLRGKDIANLMNAEARISEKLLKEISFGEYVSFENTVHICLAFGLPFCELFMVRKSNENVKALNSETDENIALQIHKYIEMTRRTLIQDSGNEVAATNVRINPNPRINREIKLLMESVKSYDEIMYLKGSLKLYRELKLKSDLV